MVFVWSHLTKGDAAYTLVQVAVNDLILLIAFTPIVAFLLGISDVIVPYNTLFLSVFLFVVIPLLAGYVSRNMVVKSKGQKYFEEVFLKKFDGITVVGLLLTLIIIFSFQGDIILDNPLHIVLIAVPLILQTFFIFIITYSGAKLLKLSHAIAAPGAMMGASNFFELAVAVAISLFGLQSGATLVTVVGVLVEVPLMLVLVNIANRTKSWFKEA
jgi:ACR3 family arsenite transporter